MDIKHVEGKNAGKVIMYALSTCIWCKKTKRFLGDLGVSYDYIDVDLLDEEEREKTKQEIKKWNPKCSFPTIVVNNKECIVGYNESKMQEVFGNEK